MTSQQKDKIWHNFPQRKDKAPSLADKVGDIKALNSSIADASLANYRRSLISQQAEVFENQEPVIQVQIIRIYDDENLVYCSQVSQAVHLVLKEQKLYDVEIEFSLSKAILYGLTISNSIYKSIIRLSKQQYRQGTFAPNPFLQTARFSIKTPGGLLGRGSYRGQACIKDKHSKIYFELPYQVQIVSNS